MFARSNRHCYYILGAAEPDWGQKLKYYGGFPRLAEVQALGGAYVYLLSDAASYTTSIDIPVNGVIGSKCSINHSLRLITDVGSLLISYIPLCVFYNGGAWDESVVQITN